MVVANAGGDVEREEGRGEAIVYLWEDDGGRVVGSDQAKVRQYDRENVPAS